MKSLRFTYFLRVLYILLLIHHAGFGQHWHSSYSRAHENWGKSWESTISDLKEAEVYARRDLGIFDQDYLVILNDLGLALYESGNYDEATTVLEKSLNYRKEILDENDKEYAVAQLNLARVYADNSSAKAISIYQQLSSSEYLDVRIKAIKGIYDLYAMDGRLSDARSFIDTLLLTEEKEPKEYRYVVSLLDIDQLRQSGKFRQAKSALEAFSESVDFSEISVLNLSLEAIYYEQRGLILMEEKEFAEAEKCLLRVLNIKKKLGFQEGELVASRNNLAALYEKFGFYDKALNEIETALSNCSHNCEKLYQNKAAILLMTGKVLESEVILNELYENYTFRSPEEELEFLLTYSNTFRQASWTDMNPALERAAEVVERAQNTISARSLGHYYAALGAWFVRNSDITEAVGALENAKGYYEEAYGKESLMLRDVETNLGICYFLEGNKLEGIHMLASANDREKKLIRFVFPMLSRTEQAVFMEQMRDDLNTIYSAVMDDAQSDSSLARFIYDKQLMYKGLSLKSNSVDLQTGLSDIPPSALEEFVSLRSKLTRIFTQGKAYTEGFENADLIRLQELETMIARQSGKGHMKGEMPYDSLVKMISDEDVVVEMIRYRNYNFRDVYNVDSVSYAAMIIRAEDTSHPAILPLASGSFMELRQLKYYLNAINYGIRDTISYRQLWQPLNPYLKEKKTCYFISDGLYYKVNPSAFWIPEEQKFLSDRMNIRQLNNLYELESATATTMDYRKPNHALLVGDPDLGGPGEQSRFSRLEGAGAEIQNITARLNSAGWEVDRLVQKHATKDNLDLAPRQGVLHFATHGYFSEREVAGEQDLPDLNLFRSGLVLSDPETSKGELLTAFEVAAMDLSQTDLVVLSACETGLGEIRNGDGVYGLQYAFFAAGSRSVLISLWQVSDKVTAEYMEVFYDQLLSTGNKRKAYENVQSIMRARYPDPKYWAAFIYLGE